jgi:hypothetical protein
MADGLEWVKKDAYVMPELPASLKVDPILAALLHVAAFLEISGDETVDPDWAIEALEYVGHYLQQLPAHQVKTVREQVGRVAVHARKKKWGAEAVKFFTQFQENFVIDKDDG